ncbi:MAG: ADP-ribosylglycohydrolase family protein [Deltaproteobacteria bacterium]|nr:ADP-ribosylglycohydrolase family protein [Deltaproteobacteria bacterium]
MAGSIFDAPAFCANLFFPRAEARPCPPGARDVAVEVSPGVRLHARIHDAPSASVAVLLFHGNGELVADYDTLAGSFHAASASLAVVDYRGYGRSGGKPTLRSCLTDAPRVLDALAPLLVRREPHATVPLPLVVMGRSLGSACAAELGARLPRAAAGFVLESGFTDLHAFVRRRGIDAPGVITERDLRDFEPLPKLGASTAPLLVLHGELDEHIAPDEARAAWGASAAADKRIVLLPGCGHGDVSGHPTYWQELARFLTHVARSADRRAGSLVTQALGDALGFLVEGQPPEICAHFAAEVFAGEQAPDRTRGPFAFGQYSDDTQLARELALSLASTRAWSPDDFARRLARLFATGTIVGRGRATEAAARRLLAGAAWHEAGEPAPSAGNGAAMRAAPVGLRYADAAERLRVADEQARITHLDARSRAAAILVADVVAGAVSGAWDGPANAERFEQLAARVSALDPVLAQGVRHMPAWLAGKRERAAAEIARVASPPSGSPHRIEAWPGISPFATPSALYALYAFARSPGDAAEVLRTSVCVGGDVDTVAAMAGAMVGAAVGLGGLEPRLRRWAARLQDQGSFGLPELVALGHALA